MINTSGWNAFDAATQAALRAAMARGVDCFGEPLAVRLDQEASIEAHLASRPMRARHVSVRLGQRREITDAELASLEARGAIVRDAEGFYALRAT